MKYLKIQTLFNNAKNTEVAISTNGLLTGCESHTEKYRTTVFVQPELARAVLKDQGPVFLSMARANPVNNIFLLTGLRIYTGEYKAQGPTLCPTEGGALRGPRALYSPV